MKYRFQVLTSVFVLITSVSIIGCGTGEPVVQQTPPPPPVSVAEVINQPLRDWDEFTGRLQAPETVEIRPRVSGYIDVVAFQEGALVKAGDLLFQIDPRPFKAEVSRLQAELASAEARLAQAKRENARAVQLRSQKAIAQEQADARETSAEEAVAQVAAIRAALDVAELNLEFTRVTSPINGRVSNALITAGNLIAAGESLLTTVVSTDKVHAYFDADEQVFLKYQAMRGDAVNTGRGLPMFMGLISEDGFPHQGVVDFMDNQVNPLTGTIRGRAIFDNEEAFFTPGLFVRLKLVARDAYTGILVDDKAIGTDLGKKYVLVLGENNNAQYRAIELGKKLDGLRIVKEGLHAGETIIVNGLQRVRPGAPVTPEPVAMASPEVLETIAKWQTALDEAVQQAKASVSPAEPSLSAVTPTRG